jgi:hypothetical protein
MVNILPCRQLDMMHLYEFCLLSVLLIDNCENGWRSYGNHCYLFGFSKLDWHKAKVSKIVFNKKKEGYIVYISSVVDYIL